MKRVNLKSLLLLFSIVICGYSSWAQQFPISTNILVSPPYPTNLDAYVDMLNEGVVSVENTSSQTLDVFFDVSIEAANGKLKAASNGILPTSIAIAPGVTVLSPSDIEDLFSGIGESDFTTTGLSQAEQEAFLLSRQIPEGEYKLCMRGFDANGTPLSDPAIDPCTYFDVSFAERPVILSPFDGDEVEPTEFVNLTWMHAVNGTAGNNLDYIVKIIDLTEQEIVNVQDAMLNNGVSPEYEENVGMVKFLALQNNFDLPFVVGHRYAVRVTAEDPSGSLAFQYGGHSEIVVFTYKSAFGDEKDEPTAFLPSPQFEVPETGFIKMGDGPLAFPVTWVHELEEEDSTALTKTLTYTLKVVDMDTLKITNITNQDFADDTYEYLWNREVTENDMVLMGDSAHPLVRGHKYAFSIQVESEDERVVWENDGFSDMVQVEIGEAPEEDKDPEEACGNTCIIPEPDKTSFKPVEVKGKYRFGGVDLTVTKLTGGATGAYSGEGYIVVDFIKKIKVQVIFENIKVNAKKQVFEGTAKAIWDNKFAKADAIGSLVGGKLNIDADAASAMTTALRTGKKLASAMAGKQVSLPLGFDRNVGGDNMIVGITEMSFTPTKATMSAMFSLENPEWGKYVPALGATDICFTESGFGQVVKLYLAKDYIIPLTQESLTLKASEDNTATEKGCYVIIDCDGFKEGQLTAEMSIPRTMLVPENADGEILEEGNATLTLSGTIQGSKDFMLGADLSPCQIPGLEGYSFTMENGYYDASSKANPGGIQFPQGYERAATGDDWKGVWFGSVLLKAPKDWGFSGDDRTTVGVRNFIKDDAGISVVATAENMLSIDKGSIEGFAISIDKLSLNIIRNEFIEAKVEGNLGMPILADEQYLPYEGIIDREELVDKNNKTTKTTAMSFTVKPNPDGYDLDWIKSKLVFDETSEIVLKNNSKERGVRAELSGTLTLGGTMNDINAQREPGMPEMSLPGIKFEGMEISKMKDLLAAKNPTKTTTNKKTPKNGGFKFVTPTFSFMGIDLNEVQAATKIDDTKPEDWKEPEEPKSDPKVNGFSFNLTTMDLAFGDGSGEQEISTGSQATLTVAGELSLVRGKNGGTKKKNEGLAITASGGFKIISNVTINGTKSKLDFEKFQMDSLIVDAQVSAIGIDGKLMFYNEDPTFGDGALGNVNIELPILTVGIDARFGSKEDYNYWYLFGNVLGGTPDKPVPLATFYNIISIYGFNGGAYYHMTDKGGLDPETRYVPDKTTLLGLEAGLTLSITRPEVIWGNVTLGAEFQDGGAGISMLKLRGDAYILKGDMRPRGANDEVQGIEARLDAKLNLKDLDNISFTADMKIYANVAGGAIVGNMKGGETYQMVQANLKVDKDEWYMHMGTPDKRGSLRLGVPGIKAGVTAQAYLMLGNTSMPQAQMPKRIRDLLGKSNKDFSGGTSSIGNTRNGGGFVMGASLEYELDIEASILYANFYAGFGFDLSLIEFQNVVCANNGGKPLGMDGWYAQGQVYAGLSGDIGLDIDIAIYEGRISLASLSAVMALRGGFPNPVYATGRARMSYSVLGGIVEGSTSFGVDLGEQCQADIVDPFAGIEFIAGISPPSGKTSYGVSPFVQPKISLNQRLGEYTFYTPTKTGRKKHWFKVEIEYFRVKDRYGNVVNTGSVKQSDVLERIWSSSEYLKPWSTYRVEVKLKCMKWGSSGWEVAKDKNGKAWSEYKSAMFRTGALPNKVTLNNVKITYPFISERNYMHGNNHFKTGLIKMYSNIDYLWKQKSSSSAEWIDVIRVKFYEKNTMNLVATRTFRDLKGDVIEFYMPSSLEKDKPYRIDIVRTYVKNNNYKNKETAVSDINSSNNGSGSNYYKTTSNFTIKRDGKTYSSYNSAQPKDVVLFRYYFATSKYNNIYEKLQANKTHTLSWDRDRSRSWRQINYDFKAKEGFGVAEVSSQNIEESNTKNEGKLLIKENRNNTYYNYLLGHYAEITRDVLNQISRLDGAYILIHSNYWNHLNKINRNASWRLCQSYNNIKSGKYLNNYQGYYGAFAQMYYASGASGDPKSEIMKTTPTFKKLVDARTSPTYMWAPETRKLSWGEITKGKYSSTSDGTSFGATLPGYLAIDGDIKSVMWNAYVLRKGIFSNSYQINMESLNKNRAILDPKNSGWSSTPFYVKATYTNPENPNRTGKNSYSYSYTIKFTH